MSFFRFNGFTVTIFQDYVEVSQAKVRFTFKTLDEALETLKSIA